MQRLNHEQTLSLTVGESLTTLLSAVGKLIRPRLSEKAKQQEYSNSKHDRLVPYSNQTYLQSSEQCLVQLAKSLAGPEADSELRDSISVTMQDAATSLSTLKARRTSFNSPRGVLLAHLLAQKTISAAAKWADVAVPRQCVQELQKPRR